jgi:hypothetical protein
MTVEPAERDQIRTAMDRILAGTPGMARWRADHRCARHRGRCPAQRAHPAPHRHEGRVLPAHQEGRRGERR